MKPNVNQNSIVPTHEPRSVWLSLVFRPSPRCRCQLKYLYISLIQDLLWPYSFFPSVLVLILKMVQILQLGLLFSLGLGTTSAAVLGGLPDGGTNLYARDGTNVISTYYSSARKT